MSSIFRKPAHDQARKWREWSQQAPASALPYFELGGTDLLELQELHDDDSPPPASVVIHNHISCREHDASD